MNNRERLIQRTAQLEAHIALKIRLQTFIEALPRGPQVDETERARAIDAITHELKRLRSNLASNRTRLTRLKAP